MFTNTDLSVGVDGRAGDVIPDRRDLRTLELALHLCERRIHHRVQVHVRELVVLLLRVFEEM